MDISETLESATDILRSSGITEPRREAASLLAFALQKDRTFLFAHSEYRLCDQEKRKFQQLVERRAAHEPFQYITGHQEFYGLDFAVTKAVLIPRPETELIVEHALELLRPRANPRFCEVGVGSGCISIAVLHKIRTATALGLDISAEALEIAGQNAQKHYAAERLKLELSDVFAVLREERFDLIVSNPPYVPSGELADLQAEVREFEPQIALTDGKDGLSIIRRLITESPKFLKPESFLLLEIGFSQAAKVSAMFDPAIWRARDILPDLQGIPRMVKAQLERT